MHFARSTYPRAFASTKTTFRRHCIIVSSSPSPSLQQSSVVQDHAYKQFRCVTQRRAMAVSDERGMSPLGRLARSAKLE